MKERRPASGEEGFALIIVMFFAIMGMGLIASGTARLKAAADRERTRIAVEAHAGHLARSGLAEAMSWFQRQASQPVIEFAPTLDEVSDPAIRETLDPDIGLVREISISGNLWGRYELWKQWDDDPDSARAATRNRLACRDVSNERGLAPGRVWRLKCRAIVYRKRAPNGGPFDAPNRVMATVVCENELRQSITFTPPAHGAIVTERADGVVIENGAKVETAGGVAGIVFSPGTGDIVATPGDVTMAKAPSSLDLSFESVFGVSFIELRLYADLNVTRVSDLPDELRDGTITILEAPAENVKITAQKRIRGRGVLVVHAATLEFTRNNMSDFAGVLYVTGDLELGGPLWLRGMMIVKGSVSVLGGQDVVVAYDSGVVEAASRGKGYRRRRKPFATNPGHALGLANAPVQLPK